MAKNLDPHIKQLDLSCLIGKVSKQLTCDYNDNDDICGSGGNGATTKGPENCNRDQKQDPHDDEQLFDRKRQQLTLLPRLIITEQNNNI